jgi:hypothetical protein
VQLAHALAHPCGGRCASAMGDATWPGACRATAVCAPRPRCLRESARDPGVGTPAAENRTPAELSPADTGILLLLLPRHAQELGRVNGSPRHALLYCVCFRAAYRYTSQALFTRRATITTPPRRQALLSGRAGLRRQILPAGTHTIGFATWSPALAVMRLAVVPCSSSSIFPPPC